MQPLSQTQMGMAHKAQEHCKARGPEFDPRQDRRLLGLIFFRGVHCLVLRDYFWYCLGAPNEVLRIVLNSAHVR